MQRLIKFIEQNIQFYDIKTLYFEKLQITNVNHTRLNGHCSTVCQIGFDVFFKTLIGFLSQIFGNNKLVNKIIYFRYLFKCKFIEYTSLKKV